MQPRIEILTEKKLVGKRLQMSFADNKTPELWRSFMLRRKEVKNNVNSDMLSLQVFDLSFDFKNFDMNKAFEKWAAVEVHDFDNVPTGMETFILAGGLYAVFIHKGSSTDDKTFQYIFFTWLPNSDYFLDHRPHFELLGEKYKNLDLTSEEEIWIPIRKKE